MTRNTTPARRAWRFGCIDCRPVRDGAGNIKFVIFCGEHNDAFRRDPAEPSCD